MSINTQNLIDVTPMSAEEAREYIEDIKQNLDKIRSKLFQLHRRQGWEALGYSSWKECATTEFGQSKAYVYRLLAAAEVEANLVESTIVDSDIPVTQLTELAKLPPEKQVEGFLKAVELAESEGKQRTAQHVKKAVRILKGLESEETEEEPINEVDKGKPTCGWQRIPSGGGRYYGLNLHDEETGLLIESMAQQRGKLPQTIIAEAVKELAAKDETQQRFAELEAKLAATEAELSRLKAKEDTPGELEVNPAEQLAEKLRLIVSQGGTWVDILDAIAHNETYKVQAWELLSDDEKRAVIALKPTTLEPSPTTPPTTQHSEPNQPTQPTKPLAAKFPIGARVEKTFDNGTKLVGTVTGYLNDKWVQFMSDGGYSDMGRELNLRLLELPLAVSA